MEKPPTDRKPTCEEIIEKFKEMKWMYDNKLFPPEGMKIVKELLDEFTKPKPN